MELKSYSIDPFIVDIQNLEDTIQDFLQADILVVNIPSKNITGFEKLIVEIEKSGVQSVIFVSSTSVYENTNKIIVESDAAESLHHPLVVIETLFTNSRQFNTTIVRFGGLIGYSRNPARFFSAGRQMLDPDAFVNLIHRDDCVEIIARIVARDVWGETFNCCTDTHPTKREFYTQVALASGVPAPQIADNGTQSFKIMSNEKVKSVLNYTFSHPDLMDIKFS